MQFNIIITKENFNKLFIKLWHAYLLFLLLFVIIKLNLIFDYPFISSQMPV